jgi:hypothetical protein
MSHDSEILIGIGIAVIGVAGLDRLWHIHRRRKSETWPTAHGVVTETEVHKGHDNVVLTVRYSYPVEDEPYPIPAEFQKTFPLLRNEKQAQAWAEALDKKHIPVRFDPRNHWRSLLWDSDLEPIVNAHSERLN